MKRIAIGLAAASVFTLCLSGCASLDGTRSSGVDVDQAKVASVERAAMQYGIKVVWVNQPLKRVTTPGS